MTRVANGNVSSANAYLNKQLHNFHNQRYCKDKPKYRNTETYVWLQTQEGGFLWHVWIVCWKLSCFLSLTFVFCFSCGRSAVEMWTTTMFLPHRAGFLWALGTFFSLNNWENPSLRLESYIIIQGGQRSFGNMHTSDLKEIFIRWKTLHRRNWHHPWTNLC